MGRQIKIKQIDWAYIAGFLDGDGSMMAQFKNRNDTPRGWRILPGIRFYQDTRNEKTLFWVKNKIEMGHIYRRKDGMTELRLEGWKQVLVLLENIKPYARFKKNRVDLLLKIAKLVNDKKVEDLTIKEKDKIADLIWKLKEANYQSGSKKFSKSREEIKRIIGI